MPLTFPSMTHGDVAFGFFNIETDLMLLNEYFFFAGDFCANITELATLKSIEPALQEWRVWVLNEKDIGDLSGAIRGVKFTGFIGDIYQLYPFPDREELFKQNPEGFKTRAVIEEAIGKYAGPSDIRVVADRYSDIVKIGKYIFHKDTFHGLLRYVWVGGYPRWKDDVKPGYVLTMKDAVCRSVHPTFMGIEKEMD